jgi:hypothetical protein
MLEYVIGGIILIVILLEGYMNYRSSIRLSEQLNQEGDLVKENLNHLAGAIISLSELLDDADEVIEHISKVPTVGEIIQQALMGFISQKMSQVLPEPVIEPMEGLISDFVTPEVESDGTKTKKSKEEINTNEI